MSAPLDEIPTSRSWSHFVMLRRRKTKRPRRPGRRQKQSSSATPPARTCTSPICASRMSISAWETQAALATVCCPTSLIKARRIVAAGNGTTCSADPTKPTKLSTAIGRTSEVLPGVLTGTTSHRPATTVRHACGMQKPGSNCGASTRDLQSSAASAGVPTAGSSPGKCRGRGNAKSLES